MTPDRAPSQIWSSYLAEDERARLAHAGFSHRVGYGERPALVVVDVQNYMIGDRSLGDDELTFYPSSCREMGRDALQKINDLCEAFRRHGHPVIETRFALARDGSDAGVYQRKRDLLRIDGWCMEGTDGSKLADGLDVQASDHIITKTKPSAFVGTTLLSYLIEHRIDDLVVVGGSTSNCVRATVVDAASLNFRVQVCADAVFDRVMASHAISLFDLDRQYADVVWTDDIIDWLGGQTQ
jgi:maleamate amidohydrolase